MIGCSAVQLRQSDSGTKRADFAYFIALAEQFAKPQLSLKAARLTFPEKRYLYEKKKGSSEWFYADFLGKSIRSVAIKDANLSKLAKL
jgi:hypothetical protein